MTIELLRALTAAEFEAAFPVLPPAPALRVLLGKHDAVRAVAVAYERGTLTDENIEELVETKLAELERAVPFAYDLAFAALAVALEASKSEFATRFLEELAGLSIAEMPHSIRVARECLKHRASDPRNFTKPFEVARLVAGEVRESRFVDHGERKAPEATFTYTSRLNGAA